MAQLGNEMDDVDLRKYLNPHKQYSAWFTRKPIWLDINLGDALLFDDDEIAAAYRVLQEKGFVVTSERKDGGWLLKWRHDAGGYQSGWCGGRNGDGSFGR